MINRGYVIFVILLKHYRRMIYVDIRRRFVTGAPRYCTQHPYEPTDRPAHCQSRSHKHSRACALIACCGGHCVIAAGCGPAAHNTPDATAVHLAGLTHPDPTKWGRPKNNKKTALAWRLFMWWMFFICSYVRTSTVDDEADSSVTRKTTYCCTTLTCASFLPRLYMHCSYK